MKNQRETLIRAVESEHWLGIGGLGEIDLETPADELYAEWLMLKDPDELSRYSLDSFGGCFERYLILSLAMEVGLGCIDEVKIEIDRICNLPDPDGIIDVIEMWYWKSAEFDLDIGNKLKEVWVKAIWKTENLYRFVDWVQRIGGALKVKDDEMEEGVLDEMISQAIERLEEDALSAAEIEEEFAIGERGLTTDDLLCDEWDRRSGDDFRKLGAFVRFVKTNELGDVSRLDKYMHDMIMEIDVGSVDAYVTQHLLEYILRSDESELVKLTRVNMCCQAAKKLREGVGGREVLMRAVLDGYLRLGEYEKAYVVWQEYDVEDGIERGFLSLYRYGLEHSEVVGVGLGDCLKKLGEVGVECDDWDIDRVKYGMFLEAFFASSREANLFFLDSEELLRDIQSGERDELIENMVQVMQEWPEKKRYGDAVMVRVREKVVRYNAGELDSMESKRLLKVLMRCKTSDAIPPKAGRRVGGLV